MRFFRVWVLVSLRLSCLSQVSKVVLVVWERTELYLKEHPAIMKHMAANVSLYDEEKRVPQRENRALV